MARTEPAAGLEPVLSVRHLERQVDSRILVSDFSFDFFPGRIYSIIGPSGAGKTSLLRLLNRLDEPTSGEVLVQSEPYRNLKPTDLRLLVGFLFQTPVLFPETIRDNFLVVEPSIANTRISELLQWSAAGKLTPEQTVDSLSVGEAQRVAIARLLAAGPKVALLDEPTSALDPTATEVVERLIRHLATDHSLCVIVVTHNTDQAIRLKSETLLMVDGHLIEHGPAEQVINNPTTSEGLRFKDKELT